MSWKFPLNLKSLNFPLSLDSGNISFDLMLIYSDPTLQVPFVIIYIPFGALPSFSINSPNLNFFNSKLFAKGSKTCISIPLNMSIYARNLIRSSKVACRP